MRGPRVSAVGAEGVAQPTSRSPLPPFLACLFFLSGASGLIFETIFARLLTYTFGNTAQAVSTVLAAFLGGLALGAYLLGRWVDGRGASLRIYALLELGVAGYGLFVPRLLSLVTRVYVGLNQKLALNGWAGSLGQFVLTAFVILVPTVLMGGTLPVLARWLAQTGRDFQPALDRLYAWNTLGAAVGAVTSTYLLLPSLGVRGAIATACGINLAIFLAIARGGWKDSSKLEVSRDLPPAGPLIRWALPPRRLFLLLGAFLTGAVALAYEVVWTHLLSFIVGNTVYAFGMMLFTFLLGLGGGAYLVGRFVCTSARWARALAASQIFLAFAVIGSWRLWHLLPGLFAQGLAQAWQYDQLSIAFLLLLRLSYAGWMVRRCIGAGKPPRRWIVEVAAELSLFSVLPSARVEMLVRYEAVSFFAAELLRFFCAFYLLIIPCLLLGLSFPLLLNLATAGAREVGSEVGGLYAANALGTVVGSALTGFVVLPALGSLATLLAAVGLNLLLALGFALWLGHLGRLRKWALVFAAASLAMVMWRGAKQADFADLTRGTYVYFNSGWTFDRLLFAQEDIQGGLTTVIEFGKTRTLLSNGKFQGNNTGEVGAQARFALIPILFTHGFERALVIGLGTGHTLRVLARFPFRHIDAVEISPSIVEAARRWFADVNEGVFDRDPRIQLALADGRNFLLLTPRRFDLITIEVSSIWISGEADLYNQEFYELCRARLTSQGILQQWVQVHHMRTADLLVILNTAAQVFPHVAFFLGAEQGLLIASPAPLACDLGGIARLDAHPEVRRELAGLQLPSLASLLGELVLYDESYKKALTFLPGLTGKPADFVSSDDRPYLEYQTPKGNSLSNDTVASNVRFLSRFRPPLLPPEMPLEGLGSDNERRLLLGYVAEARGDMTMAVECFRSVAGDASPRATLEMRRLELTWGPTRGRQPGQAGQEGNDARRCGRLTRGGFLQ